jgi:hypothetical protein
MKITKAFLESGGTFANINPKTGEKNYAWNNDQLRILGLADFSRGWQAQLIGKEISDDRAQVFLALKVYQSGTQSVPLE